MPARDLLSLPFDTYQRYRLVADLARQLVPSDRPLTVLDVGGRTALLCDFLPEAEVTLVDVEASEAPGLVLGSGTALPFADRSFDLVCACDTLEHVPPARREDFVREACRVARSWAVLAGPYRSDRVVEAEELLRTLLREKLGVRHRYLDEHALHGLPDRAAVEGWMSAAGAEVVTLGHANLERWLALIFLSMYLDQDAQLRRVAERYYRFYNRALYASDHAEPVYRHAVVACLQGAPRPVREGLLDPPAAPAGSVAAFQQLAGELAAFDREREVYEAERGRLMTVNGGLEADLDGHRRKLAEVVDLHRQQQEVIATLEEDHTRHRALAEEHDRQQRLIIGGLEEDLAGHREVVAALERTVAEQDEVIGTLEQDLGEHRKTLAALRGELEAVRNDQGALVAELERNRVALDGLTSDLAGHARVIRDQQAEIEQRVAHQAEVAAHQALLELELQRANETATATNDELRRVTDQLNEIVAELQAEHRTNELLRGELNDRFRNLRRALTPRKRRF